MYEGNIDIDKPRQRWSDKQIERLFIFCQLDRVMPYEKVCHVFEYLDSRGLTQFEELRETPEFMLGYYLKLSGHRFPYQTAGFIKWNINNFTAKELRKMSRDKIAEECMGFGYKLASMFHNRIHGTDYAIIDVHVDRYLEQHGCKAKKYKEKESYLQNLAKTQNKSLEVLDWEIWNTNRIGNRCI